MPGRLADVSLQTKSKQWKSVAATFQDIKGVVIRLLAVVLAVEKIALIIYW